MYVCISICLYIYHVYSKITRVDLIPGGVGGT